MGEMRAAMVSDALNNTGGFYARALAPDDAELYAQVQVGSLDEEVRLAKLKLLKLVQLAAVEELQLALPVDDEPVQDIFGKPPVARAAKREPRPAPHYAALLQRQLELVRKLELSRFQMLGKAVAEDEVALILAEPDEEGPDAPL